MKTNHFLIATVATLAMLSCSSEEKPPTGEDVANSKLSIRIVGETNAPKGRAVGEPTQAEESTVNDFIIFVFKQDGSNDVTPKEFTTWPETGKTDVVITEAAKEVYVIANTADDVTVNTALKAVTKKSDLQAVLGRGFASTDPDAAVTQTATDLWMSGENDAAFTPIKGESVPITVTLKYVAAKVRITSVTVDAGLTLTQSEVTVLNGGAVTKLIPADEPATSLIPTFTPGDSDPFYVSGADMTNFQFKPEIYKPNLNYKYALMGSGADKVIGVGKNQHYFYVFENDGETFKNTTDPKHGQPTIVSLKCLHSLDAVYYSIFFKADPNGTLGYDNMVIERGKSYDIAMTIKKLGNADPTIPLLKTTVEVTITPAKWDPVTINKVYE